MAESTTFIPIWNNDYLKNAFGSEKNLMEKKHKFVKPVNSELNEIILQHTPVLPANNYSFNAIK